MKKIVLLILTIGLLSFRTVSKKQEEKMMNKQEIATFGGGCFWCTEAVFSELEGVINVESGYSGGEMPNPTYKDISTGTSGHAEVIHITFNPKKPHS